MGVPPPARRAKKFFIVLKPLKLEDSRLMTDDPASDGFAQRSPLNGVWLVSKTLPPLGPDGNVGDVDAVVTPGAPDSP